VTDFVDVHLFELLEGVHEVKHPEYLFVLVFSLVGDVSVLNGEQHGDQIHGLELVRLPEQHGKLLDQVAAHPLLVGQVLGDERDEFVDEFSQDPVVELQWTLNQIHHFEQPEDVQVVDARVLELQELLLQKRALHVHTEFKQPQHHGFKVNLLEYVFVVFVGQNLGKFGHELVLFILSVPVVLADLHFGLYFE